MIHHARLRRARLPLAPAEQGRPPKASISYPKPATAPPRVPRCARCASRHAQHACVEVERGLGVLDAHHRLQRGTGMFMIRLECWHAAALPSAPIRGGSSAPWQSFGKQHQPGHAGSDCRPCCPSLQLSHTHSTAPVPAGRSSPWSQVGAATHPAAQRAGVSSQQGLGCTRSSGGDARRRRQRRRASPAESAARSFHRSY